MTTISADRDILTVINTFAIDPEHQEELAQLLIQAGHEVMVDLPGFISANVHKSLDGTEVVNYTQWENFDCFLSMLKNPKAIPHLDAVKRLAKSFKSVRCKANYCLAMDDHEQYSHADALQQQHA